MDNEETNDRSKTDDVTNAVRVFFTYGAILLSAWVFWGILNPPSKYAYNPYKAAHSHEIPSGVLIPPPEIDPSTQTQKKPSDKEIEQWRAERSDLAAQWETADMANLAFRMGILGVVLIGWTIFETRNAADKTRDAIGVAERSLEATQFASRTQLAPYLGIRVNAVPVEPGSTEKVVAAVRVKNYGQTPAVNISAFWELSDTVKADDVRFSELAPLMYLAPGQELGPNITSDKSISCLLEGSHHILRFNIFFSDKYDNYQHVFVMAVMRGSDWPVYTGAYSKDGRRMTTGRRDFVMQTITVSEADNLEDCLKKVVESNLPENFASSSNASA